MLKLDLTNQKFGRLTALYENGKTKMVEFCGIVYASAETRQTFRFLHYVVEQQDRADACIEKHLKP